ncbi:hypothetical protein [Rhizobium chutanense]|uniref:Uncharacterized protein n=1 Tax=Rhizobium chutanense TaxID=2035448 RepID=A0A432P1X1_9HYPH|nr:hypothetical protein [Rhizobium chutanense]RUM05858.1 hypothetical protein EFR84_15030 [Rhizobium chutanense]
MALILWLAILASSVDERAALANYAMAKAESIELAQSANAQSYSVPVRIIEQPDSKTETDRLREQAADDREIKDLSAQERMRDIAQDTFYLSIAQVVLTVAGTMGLLYSLLLARQSTRAAIAAVQLTSKTSKDQLRAYVLIDRSGIVFHEGGGASVMITVRKGGQTPARDMVIGCSMKSDDINYPTPLPPVEFNPAMSRFSVLPNGSRDKEIGPITADQAMALAKGETIMHVWGEVRYRDIFDQNHYSRFHLVGGGKYGFQDGKALIVLGDGNEEGEYPS